MSGAPQLKPPNATTQPGVPTPHHSSLPSTSRGRLATTAAEADTALQGQQKRVTVQAGPVRAGASAETAAGSPAIRAGRTEWSASLSGATKTVRKSQRVLRPDGVGTGGSSIAGPSTQKRPPTTLAFSQRLAVDAASASPSASTSSTALRPLPPNVAATPSRARRLVTPTFSHDPPRTIKEPLTPSTVRPRTRVVSSSATSVNMQQPSSTLSRSMSKSTSSNTILESPRTVRPATRTLPKPPETAPKPSASVADDQGKKATVGGLGRPSVRERNAAMAGRRRSSIGGRSISAASTYSPLGQFNRTPSASLAASQTVARPPRPPAAPTASTNRTLPSSRRLGQAQSAIPVSTASIADRRTLRRRADSGLSTKSRATLRRDPPSRPVSRTAMVAEKTLDRPRESLAASQTSRKSSWETVGLSAQPSSSGRDGPSHRRSHEADQNCEMGDMRTASTTVTSIFLDASYATSRKLSAAPAPGTILSPPSPSSPSSALSTADPNLSQFSHSSFLSPLPSAPSDLSSSLSLPKPPPLPLARTLASATRRPRESASLEDIIRLGLLNSQVRRGSSLRSAAAGDELEFLLDEGSSRLMSEELASSIGAGDGDVGGGGDTGEGEKREIKDSPMTPWRGRVVSLSGSTSARKGSSFGAAGGAVLPASPSAGSDATQGGKVLLLRQSTTEVSDLRRQVASLLVEIDLLKRAQSGREVVHEDGDDGRERAMELEQELVAAREREEELRRVWEEERRAMEEDPTPSAVNSAQVAFLSATNRSLSLSLQFSDALCAVRQTSTLYDAVQSRAKMERDEVKGSLDALKAIAAGLRAWEGALQVV